MKTATAISIPTAPVLPAIRHIFFTSGSMAGVPVSRRGLEIKAARTDAPRPVGKAGGGRSGAEGGQPSGPWAWAWAWPSAWPIRRIGIGHGHAHAHAHGSRGRGSG